MKKSILVPYERYQRLQQQQSEQSEQQQPEKVAEIIKNQEGLSSDHILEALPKRYKYKAGAILTHMQRDPSMSWNDKGELIYHGKVIPNSHIVDLLKDSQYQHKGRQLSGQSEFYKGLKESHLPATLMRVVDIKPPGIPAKKQWIHV